jgi:predicted NBD/HSP70 family sugar kinase
LDQALDVIAEYLSDVPARIGQTVDALQGVGLGIPGIVDSMTGQIKLCWRLDLKDYDLAKAVGKRWDLPTVIENDVKLAAWAEAEHLAIELPESLLFLALNASDDQQSDALYGLGMSVIHQGKLQTGANNAAGELQNLHSLLGFIEMTHEDLQSLRLPDAPVNPAMDRFAQTVGTMLSLLTDLIDPELIVLGGSLEIHNARILDQIQQRIVTTRVHQADDCLRMCTSTCGERGVCNGAALLARRSVVHEVLAGLEKSNARQPRTSHV